MATAAGSSPLEDLDLSKEEVQRLTSAFQDPDFRRMFSEYAQEITDPDNRRRYEAEITALERERGVEVRFVHPEPGYVLRTSLDGARRCYVNVCSNALVGAPSSRPGPAAPAPSTPATAPQPAPTEPRCSVVQRHLVDLQDYRCSRDSAPSPVPHELVVTIELPLLRSAEQAALEVSGKLLCLDSSKPDYRLRLSLPYPVDDSRGKAQFIKARRQLVVTLPVAQCAALPEPSSTPEESPGAPGSDVGSAAPGAPEQLVPESVEPNVGTSWRSFPGLEKEQPPGAGSWPGDAGRGSPCASSRGAGGESPAGSEGAGGPRSGRAMGGSAAESGDPSCPALQCSQDEDSLTLLVQVPGVQPQSLRGDLNPLRYKLNFATQDLAYSFHLQFAPENKLSTKEPEISVSSDNAVIVLAKSPGSRGHWREWFYGLNSCSLEERLFVSEENVNEFLEEVLNPPFKQTVLPTPPLIEVLQVTDEKIQIHAKLQECSNPDQLQGKEKRINEGCPLTENENIEHLTTSTIDSDSSISVKAPEIDICGSVAGFQQEPLDVSQMQLGKSQPLEAKMEPQFVKEKSATYSNEEDNLKEPVITEEKQLDGDHQSSSLNKTVIHNTTDFDSIKEINMQDGSVQIIKDHVTHCAFSFQNSLLYDLD
ncbi:Protein kintoun [Heterocephalus glaber]|uniref:Protein kintoun n=1 Tax=Heterocephalus glaber TaxID=10181 RepID=G5BW67_HETGA|nr:Protein kintoun [Heterocephalus glaber]